MLKLKYFIFVFNDISTADLIEARNKRLQLYYTHELNKGGGRILQLSHMVVLAKNSTEHKKQPSLLAENLKNGLEKAPGSMEDPNLEANDFFKNIC